MSEELHHAFEQVCAGKTVEVQLYNIANFSNRHKTNHCNTFCGLFENFLHDGSGTVDGLYTLLRVIVESSME